MRSRISLPLSISITDGEELVPNISLDMMLLLFYFRNYCNYCTAKKDVWTKILTQTEEKKNSSVERNRR